MSPERMIAIVFVPDTAQQLLGYLRSHYRRDEPLPGKRSDTELTYQGIGRYDRDYEHLRNQSVVIIRSNSSMTLGDIKLFPRILLTLLQAYAADERERETIESLNNKLEDFLRNKGFTPQFPGLYTNESYYAAMTRRLYRKLETASVALERAKPLTPYQDYSREEVHAIFAPNTPFTPQRGSWGLHGIVAIPERPGDFVFLSL